MNYRLLSPRSRLFLLCLTLFGWMALPAAYAQVPTWTVNPNAYESTMSVMGQLHVDGALATNPGNLIAAFVGTEVRGVTGPIDVAGTPMYFLTIHGSTNGELVTFQAFNATTGLVEPVSEALAFETNASLGIITAPFSWSTLQPGLPAPALVAPTDNATHQPTTVDLIWQTVPTATAYDFQLSTSEDFVSLLAGEVGLTATTSTVNNLANNTTYYWRVRAANAAGSGPWSAGFAFVTAAPGALPAAPALIAPNDGATNTALPVPLSWTQPPGALSFDLQLATDALFPNTIINESNLTQTTFVAEALQSGTTYYWRVRGVNAVGPGPWSASRSFTTSGEAPPGGTTPGAVTMLTPSDGAENQPTTIDLIWQAVSEAATYEVQLSTSQTFSAIVREETGLTATTYTVSNLANNTTYYWRVRGVNAVGPGPWATGFVFTTAASGALPAAPALVAPADGATNTPLMVSLTWTQPSGALSYDLQVATDVLFLNTIINEGNLAEIAFVTEALQPGTTYYWRVRGVNAAGTGPWAAGFHFTTTTTQTLPSAPTLVTPANGADNQPTTVQLAWQTTPTAITYDVQLSTSQTFSAIVTEETGLTATTYTVSTLTNGTTYYWRVRAANAAGEGPWAVGFAFTTAVASGSLPAAPALVAPSDGATNTSLPVPLTWTQTPGALSYDLQLATDPTFTTRIDESNLTQTTFVAETLQPGTTYYWRVRGVNTAGNGPWSTPRSFTTSGEAPPSGTAPGTVTMTTPANGAVNQPTTVQLIWQAATAADTYEVQLSTSQTFSTFVTEETGLTITTYTVSNLADNTTYYWRVRGVNAVGPGPWATGFVFTTAASGALPAAPALVAPADGALDQATRVWLVWQTTLLADGYDLQVATDPTFTTVVVDEPSLNEIVFEVLDLTSATTYHWRVRGRNSSGPGPWSSPFRFTTAATLPAAPTLLAPTAGAEDQPTRLWLVWQEVPGADTYDLQLATVADFSTLVLDVPALNSPLYEVMDLAEGTTYYWRVRGVNTVGDGPWSALFTFTTLQSTSTDVERLGEDVPEQFSLSGNYPNPFNPTTTIGYALQETAHVRLTVYDLTGRAIATLVDIRQPAGQYVVSFEAGALPSGVYLYRLQAGPFAQVRKMTLVH